MKKAKAPSGIEPDLVWRILEDVSDYGEQLRLSAVCKEWSLVCKSLPKLRISFHYDLFGSRPTRGQRGQILEKAMQGRSNLRELEVYLPIIREQDFFDMVQHVPSTIEKLTLHKIFGKLLQPTHRCEFPKLLEFNSDGLDLESPGSSLILPNFPKLKVLDISRYDDIMSGSAMGEIIRSCPSLEDFTAGFYKGPVHLRSDTLVHLDLRRQCTPETVIEACNLKSLRLTGTSPSLVLRAGNIQYLEVDNCENSLHIPLLHQLKLLILKSPTVPKLPFLSNLKHLVIRWNHLCQSQQSVTLQQFVPPQLEVLCFDAELNITADKMFWKEMETEAEILELLLGPADDLPCFPSLKSVVVTFYDNERVKLAFPLLVQLLRCSPRLERLILDTFWFGHVPGEFQDIRRLDNRVHLQDEKTYSLAYPDVRSYTLY